MYDVAIIGAGVIGSFIARELSRYELKILIIEKDEEVANGVTKANTAIVHSGYSPKEGTLKAKLNKSAAENFPQICKELDIPFKKTGSILIAFDAEGMEAVYEKYTRGKNNGVKGMKIVTKEEILELEPNLNKNIYGGLYVSETGIVSNWEMAIAACENAVDNGVQLELNTEVKSIKEDNGIFYIHTNKEIYKAKTIINCAGLFTEEINNMLAKPFFKIKPRKGQYIVLDKDGNAPVNHVIFLAKSKDDDKRKGIIIAPTVSGNTLVGPSADEAEDKTDLCTTGSRLSFIREITKEIMPTIDFSQAITTFAALRPKMVLLKENFLEEPYEDFVIEKSKDVSGLLNVAGIKSPGLTCAPSIAVMVKEILEETLDNMPLKAKFSPYRRSVIRLNSLSEEEKNKLIHQNPLYGNIVCRCEQISEGEIVDAIRRNAGATTVDGIKRRVRAGMGKCQGGFCLAKVLEVLARELGIKAQEINKCDSNSYILKN